MNILPHKSWHVRTKKNIARVRKDEAEAAEQEKEKQRKIALAAQESRTAVLRQRASERLATAATSAPLPKGSIDNVSLLSIPLAPVTDIVQQDGHVNFFQDVEDGKRQGGVNDEAESEKKKEQEDYEKKIGYLVYLGQDSLESTKQKPWYANIDRNSSANGSEDFEKIKSFEKSGYLDGLTKDCKLTTDELKLAKFKSFQDPLKDIRKYLKTPGITHKLGSVSGTGHLSSTPSTSATKRKASTDLLPVMQSKPKMLKRDKNKKKAKKSKKSKKHKHSHKSKRHKNEEKAKSSESEYTTEEDSEEEEKRKNLEKLRADRLEREREEKRRTEQLLAKLRGDKDPEAEERNDHNHKDYRNSWSSSKKNDSDSVTEVPRNRVKQKYNSQFNPDLARQNYDYS